jgi:hypothetical protein
MPAGKWNAWIRGRGASGEAAWLSCWEWIPVTTGFGELLQWHGGSAGLTQEELAGRGVPGSVPGPSRTWNEAVPAARTSARYRC